MPKKICYMCKKPIDVPRGSPEWGKKTCSPECEANYKVVVSEYHKARYKRQKEELLNKNKFGETNKRCHQRFLDIYKESNEIKKQEKKDWPHVCKKCGRNAYPNIRLCKVCHKILVDSKNSTHYDDNFLFIA